MRLIKKGVTRWVLLTEKYAIKFPRFDYGWRLFIEGIRANLNEREFYEIANIPDNELTKALPYICPIHFASWGAWIIVMPRCKPLTHGPLSDELAREAFLVLEKLVGDHKDDNYGVHNGNIVMFDYGALSAFLQKRVRR